MAKLNDEAIRAIIDGISAEDYYELLYELEDKDIIPDESWRVYDMDSFDEFMYDISPYDLACRVSDGSDCNGDKFDAHAEYFRFDEEGQLQSLYSKDVVDAIIGDEAFDFLYTVIEDLAEADDLPEVLAKLAENASAD